MITRRLPATPRRNATVAPRPTLRRRAMCQLIAVALFGGGAAHAATPPAFSQAWFAAKQQQAATAPAQAPGGGNNVVSYTPGTALQQQRVQQSITNLNNAAAALAAQMQQQKDAQAAAVQLVSTVPNGLGEGALKPSAGIAADPTQWQNALKPTDTVAAGKHTVEVKQTAKKAILTWDSFNVGRDTTLYFNQAGGNLSGGGNDWIALNRVNDPTAKPSQILGAMKAEGTVYVLNRNGVVFGQGAQVNTRSLLASSMNLFSDDLKTSNNTFLTSGLSDSARNSRPVLIADTSAQGSGGIVVEKGASLAGGADGFILLAAPRIANHGAIVADDGQVFLGSAPVFNTASNDGQLNLVGYSYGEQVPADQGIDNTGLIQARRGTITVAGPRVNQDGVVVASTSISRPGSIALQADGAGFPGPLELGKGSVTAVLPEKDGATTSSTADADKVFVPGKVALSGLNVTLDNGALVEVPGGKVTVSAIQALSPSFGLGRIYVDAGATIDVSGLANVELPMSALLVSIPRIGQNELADAPLLRDGFLYRQKNVLIDSTVSGTRADGLDWIGSPILNAKGYVENMPRDISQMLTGGGSVTLDGYEVVTRTGAHIGLDGGYLAYQSGWINTPNLLGADGRIYNIASADPDVAYVGFAGQFTADHARWGVSQTYNSPLLGGARRYQEGFVKGAHAGTLTVHAQSMAMDGEVTAAATPGTQQASDGTQPGGGIFILDHLTTSIPPGVGTGIRLQQSAQTLESLLPGFGRDTAWSDLDVAAGADAPWMVVSADKLRNAGFDVVNISIPGAAFEETAGTTLAVGPGGGVSITAGGIDIFGGIAAPAGNVSLQVANTNGSSRLAQPGVWLHDGAVVSARGQWVNDTGADATQLRGSRWIDGGTVSIGTQTANDAASTVNDGTGSIILDAGSTIDVSGGGYVDAHGNVLLDHGVPAGRGGDVSLQLYQYGQNEFPWRPVPPAFDHARIALDGTVRGFGFAGGGALTLRAIDIQVGGDPSALPLANGLWLPASFFAGQGFSRYNLDGVTDVSVAAGEHVVVKQANLLGDIDALRTLPSDSDLYAAPGVTGVGYLDDWQRWATRGTAAAALPGLTLKAGDYINWKIGEDSRSGPRVVPGVSGTVLIGTGATVDVDAAGIIDLSSYHNVIVDGSLATHGGTIALSTNAPLADTGLASWLRLGAAGSLDVSGTALVDTHAAAANSASGRVVPRTGEVLAGGSVSMAGPEETFIVADDGSRIDIAGASATFDLPVASQRLNGDTGSVVPTSVWSDAGSIRLGASAGLYLGAVLQAQGGAVEAEGGSLQVLALNRDDPSAVVRPRGILVSQSAGAKPSFASSVDMPGDADGTLAFAADVLDGSGISSLLLGPEAGALGTYDAILPVAFTGDVAIEASRQVAINASSVLALPAGAAGMTTPASYVQGAGHVSIRAPYVQLTGVSPSPVAVAGAGILDVAAANIDLGGMVNLQGWKQARFQADDDLRFTFPPYLEPDGAQTPAGMLFSTGDLTFAAGQVYPASAYRFAIDANASGFTDADGHGWETHVTFLPAGPALPPPLSAGGSLLVSADHIEQQGTLRVPSGSLVLGTADPAADAAAFGLATGLPALASTRSVHLATGSVTSVSLDGMTVPYGNTVDGVDWRYAVISNQTAPAVSAPPGKQVAVHGGAVALDAGATIDLHGGGELQASEFVPGVGGTRDLLATAPNGATAYAILPGPQGKLAANDIAMQANGTTMPGAGRQVYLDGVPGLAAGYYTLLPAQYATLPGALRIYQDTTSRDALPGRVAAFADGSYAVGGYYGDALTGARDARTTTFVVQSAPVWQQYSQYRLTDAGTFFSAAAAKKGQVTPPLPVDAGRLQISASQALALGATLGATPATGGRTSQVDIAGQAIQILGAGDTARDGYLGIAADGLSTLGAGSLLIGGARHNAADGDHVDVSAQGILVSNDASHPLAGQEIILVAGAGGDGITLEDGSVVAARGDGNPVASQPLVFGRDAGTDASGNAGAALDGSGALLRVSQNGAASVTRLGLPAAPTGGALTIGAGATVAGGAALTLDATGRVRADESAVLSGNAIDATASRIAFVGAGAAGPDDGLAIGPATLAQWRGSDTVSLRSRGSIDFLGAQDIDIDNRLTLSAGALRGDGSAIGIHAGTVVFGNELGAAAGEALGGAGTLRIDASEIDFGQGTATLRGFDAFDASAATGFVGTAQGGMDFGNAAVNLVAPVFVADGGAATTLATTGAMRLQGGAGAALTRDGLGGSLALRAADIDVGMDLKAPAGALSFAATQGGVHVASGATLDAAGVAKQFFDTAAYAPGGRIGIAATGDIAIDDGASIRYAGAADAGDAGAFSAVAGGNLRLGGTYDGHAAQGYRGGYLTLGTGGALDLDAVASLAAASGATGLVDITSGQGDLALSAGHVLKAGKVYLYANGGTARIDGTVDASSPAGSHIEVWGRQGVDIAGTLDAHVTTPEQRGGDVVLGTTGTATGALDPVYGYEQVARGDAGYIHVGPAAVINVAGGADTAFAGGKVSLRAPLLADGDVPITIDNPGSIRGARDVTVEPYAVWSTTDAPTDAARHFDGVIDPAGWFAADGTTMVPGTWTDEKGAALPAPADLAQQADYLTRYYFTPDAINTDHAGFFGYAGGDAANGPGTLMGFVGQPGFTFGDRFAGIANVHVRPGIELRNPADGTNRGDIEVVTNWNLGAGTTDADGKPRLAYRFDGEAPILTVRASGNLDLKASITDGFYQQNNGAQLNDPPKDDDGSGAPDDPQYDAALASYQAVQAYLDANAAWNGTIKLSEGDAANGDTPGGGTADISKDPFYQPVTAPAKAQEDNYYVNYQGYINEVGTDQTGLWAFYFVQQNSGPGFLAPHPLSADIPPAPQPADFGSYDDYNNEYTNWLLGNFGFGNHPTDTPSPLLAPVDADYAAWTTNYTTYLSGHLNYFLNVLFSTVSPSGGTALFYAPYAPKLSPQPTTPTNPAYAAALAGYQKAQVYLDANSAWNGTIKLSDGDAANGDTPGGGVADISKDPYYQPLVAPALKQTDQYYTNYQKYINEVGDDQAGLWAFYFVQQNSGPGFLAIHPLSADIPAAPQPAGYANYTDYSNDYSNWLLGNFGFGAHPTDTPSPLLLPVDSDYAAWSANYDTYINGHLNYFLNVLFSTASPSGGTALFYAPFAPRNDADTSAPPAIAYGKPAPDNTPSNMPTYGNATSLASATLLGGPSTSYRLVAGADAGGVDPLGTSLASQAQVTLDGHFAVKDTVTDPAVVTPNGPLTGKTLLLPTTVRTGTGSIDVASAGDIRWLDTAAPATLYTAGEPAPGTDAGTNVRVLRPAEAGSDEPARYQLDMLVNDLVNPDHAGDIRLRAGGDIEGIQTLVDADGSQTKDRPGDAVSQYWWQWLQTGYAADGSRSSIAFANFRQGVMSAGGDVSVDAGGDISELSVSLPTTAYKDASLASVTTVGGGDLSVHAGGDILSGTYLVGRGTGDIRADGALAASPAMAHVDAGYDTGTGDLTMAVAPLFAMQDGRVSVSARQGIDIGGVYDPSYFRLGVGRLASPDSQPYSTTSSFQATSASGDVIFASLFAAGYLFSGNVPFEAAGVAGPVLPATLGLSAMGGSVEVRNAGLLFPSATGNLTLLAANHLAFNASSADSWGKDGPTPYFGLIDSAPDEMPSLLAPASRGLIPWVGTDARQQENAAFHEPDALHADDTTPVRLYAVGGDIINGENGVGAFFTNEVTLFLPKQADIRAGRDIVNLSLVGQHTRRDDITRISAGRDIYDTPYALTVIQRYPWQTSIAPSLLLGGPGTLVVDAGRDIGPFTSQADVALLGGNGQSYPTGIQAVGNLYNPYLPHESADVLVNFGVGPGVDTASFVARYMDGVDGLPSLVPDLVAFMQKRIAGQATATGHATDDDVAPLSPAEARALFASEPEIVQRLFAQTELFKLLAQVGADYNDASSPYAGQYARGYAALGSMFPASLGYTANGAGQGGLNGTADTVSTGDLDIRSSTIQTQQGGNVTLLGPGGQALIGSTAAPARYVDAQGNVLAGPNSMGLLTLENGDINVFTDRSLLLAQSRVFTERGGDVTIWSSNGDINAGQGAKTSSEIPPPTFLCDIDAWCRVDARGQVSGAGIATLQTVEGAPPGNAYLVAPRGTVDAGDAGIRVSGNLVIAAARVANADNIQVKGDAIGIPVTAAVNIGALNAASAAATAASQAAEDVVRKQQSDARDKMPSEISVRVLRDGDNTSSVAPRQGYDNASPVQVLGGAEANAKLTDDERRALRRM